MGRFDQALLEAAQAGEPSLDYINNIPYEVRQRQEELERARIAQELDDRHAFQGVLETLQQNPDFHPGAQSFANAFAGQFMKTPTKETRQQAVEALAMARRVAGDKERTERVEEFGTPYSYEARRREAEGGMYRDDQSAAAMLAADPVRMLAELTQQKARAEAQVPVMLDGAGGFGNLGDTRPSTERRRMRLNDLFHVATTRATRRQAVDAGLAGRGGGGKSEAKAVATLTTLRTARQAAANVGVDAVIAELEDEALANPTVAARNMAVIEKLSGKRVLAPSDPNNPEAAAKFFEQFRDQQKLPADQAALDFLLRMRDEAETDRVRRKNRERDEREAAANPTTNPKGWLDRTFGLSE